MSRVARKYREIAAGLVELARDVPTAVERDTCIAFAFFCVSSARAIEDNAQFAGALRGDAAEPDSRTE